MRRNDVDVVMSCKDPTLQNTLLKGLAKDVNPYQSDNEGLSDEEIASQSFPRNIYISDIVNASSDLQETIPSSQTNLNLFLNLLLNLLKLKPNKLCSY